MPRHARCEHSCPELLAKWPLPLLLIAGMLGCHNGQQIEDGQGSLGKLESSGVTIIDRATFDSGAIEIRVAAGRHAIVRLDLGSLLLGEEGFSPAVASLPDSGSTPWMAWSHAGHGAYALPPSFRFIAFRNNGGDGCRVASRNFVTDCLI
jgi:hypothetical protein